MVDIDALIESVDLVSYIEQYVDLEYKSGEHWGSCPFHLDETPSFAINESKNMWYCQSCSSGGTVIQFCEKYHNVPFQKALEMLCTFCGKTVDDLPTVIEPLKILKKYKLLNHQKYQITAHQKLSTDSMVIYDNNPILEWIKEGISIETLNKYQVRYDKISNGIVFPIWDNIGNIINIKKRTLSTDYKENKKPKYIYYNKIGTLDFLYGYYQHKDNFKDYPDVILVEGEKSVMKLEEFGYFNGISLLTSHATQEQIKILINLRKDITIALDKGVDIKMIRDNFRILSKFTNVYIIIDKNNLLDIKDAPVDKTKEIFETLYENRVKLFP